MRVAKNVAVHDHDVLPAMMVQVQEAGAEAHERLANGGNAGPCRTEDELTMAEVTVQGVELILVVGYPERGPAAAFIIAGVRAHAAVRHAAVVKRHAAGPADSLEVQWPGPP